MMPRLSERYRVIAPDLRGHGRSGHADRYTWDAYAEDIEALLGLLVGDEPYYLAGHCSGGYIGMLMSARGRRPPAALVGMEVRPPLSADEQAVMWDAARRRPRRYATLEALERAWRSYWRRQGLPIERGARLGLELHHKDASGAWVQRSDRRVLAQEPFRTYDLAVQVECPTLLIRGEESRMLNRIQFLLVACELRRGSFEELPGVGHHLMVEDPNATSALLEQFLEKVANRSEAH
jgi:pimeloyl-ACP methyl ester carboxylesterase